MGMKFSTIKKLLRNRIEDWLTSVEDDKVRNMIRQDVIVTGGCIASALLGEKINDYDLYFRTRETALAVAHYYVNVFNKSNNGVTPVVTEKKVMNCKGVEEDRIIIYIKSLGAVEDEETEEIASAVDDDPMQAGKELLDIARSAERYRPIFLSENAITLSGKIQLVVRFYGEAAELHENYDYAHAMCWYDYAENELHTPAEALEAILTKTLIYKGSLYPIASVFRLRKFIARGWRITAGQLLKIMFQISDLNLNNERVLREQLIGVDQTYMTQLLHEIGENKSQRIDSVYIAKLIDEIFE